MSGLQGPSRRGHVGIRSIVEDMVEVLPPENTNNPAYLRCHTTFGLLKNCLDKAEQGDKPEKQYKELHILEDTLRKGLDALNPVKPIPQPMLVLLNELRDAAKDAMDQGVDMDYMIKSFEDMVVKPEPTLAEKEARKPPKMVTDKCLKEVWEELKQAKEANKKLNTENNELIMKLKRAEAEIGRLRRVLAEK